MKYLNLFLLVFIPLNSFSQDLIKTYNNDVISAKIEEIKTETITYKKFNNLSGPVYHINKTEVFKIIFENGVIETFDNKPNSNNNAVSMEETKAFLVENITKYCYDHNGYLKKGYKAKFEGDYLRLTLMNKKKTDELSSELFDFKNVHAFRHPDMRGGDLAYINLHVPILVNKKKNKWDRIKLVMSVNGHENAESIVNALKHYNFLLKNKSKKPGQKF